MFGIGFSELIVILIIALIVVGPKRLPEIARLIGKTIGELRRAADDVKYSIERDMKEPSEPEDHYPDYYHLKENLKPEEHPEEPDEPEKPGKDDMGTSKPS